MDDERDAGSVALEFALLDASGPADDAPRNFRRVFDVDLTRFEAPAGERPAVDAVDAAVISGSWASTYWDRDWITDLKAWVREAEAAGLPVLGVCFGHQVLAEALGGTVVGRDDYELGYHPVRHAADAPLFAGVPRTVTAFAAHSDDVVDLPLGARKLAENDHSLHAFRRGRVVGVQFHAEFDLATAEAVVAGRDADEERTPDAAETLTPANAARAEATTAVFENFTAFVRDLRRGPDDGDGR
ncbi:MAG: type 1 glutamine amidotransferase [Halobacteriaceae archaeon]